MVDETDISQEREWFYEQRAKTVVNNLQKKNVNGQYVPSRQEALSAVLEMIPPGVVVSRGDSISVDQVGIIPELKKRNQNKIIAPLERDAEGFYLLTDREQRLAMGREAFTSDIFLTGTNAVTLDGKLVNIDGLGNRVSPMIFGPKKVIVVAGANKIVKDVTEALVRLREVAAPLNAKRHFLKHHWPQLGDLPCVRTGRCTECNHDWSICHYTVIIDGTLGWAKGRINVVLIGEELGI